jgi:hypothetical protein
MEYLYSISPVLYQRVSSGNRPAVTIFDVLIWPLPSYRNGFPQKGMTELRRLNQRGNNRVINTVVVRFEVFMAVTMKNVVFWDKKPSSYFTGDILPLRYRAQLVNAINIRGFHGSDYEEYRLLGYKTQFHTSQETHNFSAIEPSQLILCKVWGLHGGDYEECCLVGFGAVWLF